ncbi:MAG: hypothetical protein IPK83_20870 [Planctomycetes bacterium]|nr:hypothetical protein [Planctomycetota bacterium]
MHVQKSRVLIIVVTAVFQAIPTFAQTGNAGKATGDSRTGTKKVDHLEERGELLNVTKQTPIDAGRIAELIYSQMELLSKVESESMSTDARERAYAQAADISEKQIAPWATDLAAKGESQLSAWQAELGELSTELEPSHQDMKELTEMISKVETELKLDDEKVKSALDESLRNPDARWKESQARLAFKQRKLREAHAKNLKATMEQVLLFSNTFESSRILLGMKIDAKTAEIAWLRTIAHFHGNGAKMLRRVARITKALDDDKSIDLGVEPVVSSFRVTLGDDEEREFQALKEQIKGAKE